ncbi:MAG: hypothetical protein WKF63_03610 [Thermomicrobiales bacterium]
MSRQQVTVTIGADVFDAMGERLGTVDGLTGEIVNVSGLAVPMSAIKRSDDTGLHVDLSGDATYPERPVTGASPTMDVTATEQELMDRSVESARAIEPPSPATGTLDDPVAGGGFTPNHPSGDNLLGDTTVSQPFEDLRGLDRKNTTDPD